MIRRRSSALLGAAVGLAAVGCEPEEPVCGAQPLLEAIESGGVLHADLCTGALSLGSWEGPEEHLAAAPAGTPSLAWAHDELDVRMVQGRFVFEGFFGRWSGPSAFEASGIGRLTATGPSGEAVELIYSVGPRGSLRLSFSVSGEPDRVSIAFACPDGARFFGLGARPQGTDHTGTSPMLYTAEQGIGQRDYPLSELDLLQGRTGDSYFPVPYTVTDGGLGVAIGGHDVGRMFLCGEEEPGVLRFESWNDRMDLFLWPEASAREAVADWTLASGPPTVAPEWAYGPWLAVQRGTDELLALAEQVRREQIPASALWAQDWVGGRDSGIGFDLHYHWEWDEEAYPALPEAIDTLHDRGLAFLGYFNPFVTQGFREWDEGTANGYLVRDPSGEPHTFTIVDRRGGIVDLWDPEAWDWAAAYLRAAAEMGQDGWMCDFAEWMPFDGVTAADEPGQLLHNEYPLLWQELNLQVLDEVHGEGQGLCFNRSGWAGTQAIAPVTWGGDQETDFTREDGLPSAREIGVGLGLSGIGRYGSDIAGFSSLWDGPSTRELYFRWTSMGAFEPVMRTHDGLREADNWHWDRDDATRAHFTRYARLHMRLQPLWLALDRVYREQGLPFMRHALIVEPADAPWFAAVRDAPDQHFLGDDLLVAPVVEEGATERSVVFPPGPWYGLLDGSYVDAGAAGATRTVPAPLTEIPVFARAGAIVPLADPAVQTSYATSAQDVVDAADRADRLDLWVFAGTGGVVLADGAALDVEVADPTAIGGDAPSLGGTPLAASCADEEATGCVQSFDAATGTAEYRVSWPAGAAELSGSGWRLSASGLDGRSGLVTLRFPPSAR